MERKRLTHHEMKQEFLSGDKIDTTTRGDQEDFELDNLTGAAGASTDALVKLPTKKHKI
jgi:hypothetical protein